MCRGFNQRLSGSGLFKLYTRVDRREGTGTHQSQSDCTRADSSEGWKPRSDHHHQNLILIALFVLLYFARINHSVSIQGGWSDLQNPSLQSHGDKERSRGRDARISLLRHRTCLRARRLRRALRRCHCRRCLSPHSIRSRRRSLRISPRQPQPPRRLRLCSCRRSLPDCGYRPRQGH